jgi:N-acetylglucosaminyl-diphospho-decaprenol L-rhamnosyltransferase
VLTAVIVHRSQPDRCTAAVESLRDQDALIRIMIVDNGSAPKDLDRLRHQVADAEIIELGSNLGFGPAANVGLSRWLQTTGDEWAIVCPHDAIAQPGCLTKLLAAGTDRPRAGLVSAEYGNVDHPRPNHDWRTNERLKPIVDPYLGGVLVPADGQPGWEPAGHPHGTLFMARRACLEQIGLFDERYFAYCEEADLGVRARQAGWEVGVVWGAIVRNIGMSSEPGVAEYLMLRNTLLLVRDHFGRYRASVLLAISSWVTLRGALFPSRRCLFWHWEGRVLAIRDFLLGRSGPPPTSLTRPATP